MNTLYTFQVVPEFVSQQSTESPLPQRPPSPQLLRYSQVISPELPQATPSDQNADTNNKDLYDYHSDHLVSQTFQPNGFQPPPLKKFKVSVLPVLQPVHNASFRPPLINISNQNQVSERVIQNEGFSETLFMENSNSGNGMSSN